MKDLRILVFLVVVSLSGFVLSNCGDTGTVSDDDEVGVDGYIAPNSLYVEHTVGSSPCPQKIGEVDIYQEGELGTLMKADSVAVEYSDPGLDAYFGTSGVKSVALDSTGNRKLSVYFDCDPPKDVEATINVKIFKDGELVGTEMVQVDVILL